ncbi:MAG: DUF4339 domain-containing protein [Pyrinomonadaceae bacterium]|nr:DUF4339 domain-containing protein [Pyrinomonadaceae bacterium]
MQIYINKNNQQLGPFEESKVLEMLGSGQLSPNDLAIRQGENQWQRLGGFYPQFEAPIVAKSAAKEPTPKKSRTGLLLGCGGFFLLLLLIGGVLGFFAYRNMYPADSTVNLPNTVKDYKLNDRYPPKGNVWGSEANFVGIYSNESKTQTIIYLLTEFSSESAAQDAMQKRLVETCRSGETPMRFTFDKGGSQMSEGATCAIPLLVRKDNKLVQLGGSGATVDTFIEFAENLPFNVGSKMIKK